MRFRAIIVASCVGLLLTSCRQAAEVDSGPHLGRGVSVHSWVRQMLVSEQLDGPGHVLACLVWATREREDLSEVPDPMQGPRPSEGPLFKSADEAPILIVMRGYPERASWGHQTSPPPPEGPVLRHRTELLRGDEVWAAYEVTAEPFTESFILAGKQQGLDAGRILLADFASEPVRVQQVEVGGRELAEARDALADDPLTGKEVGRQLRYTLRQLANRNETIREFVGDALALPSTH